MSVVSPLLAVIVLALAGWGLARRLDVRLVLLAAAAGLAIAPGVARLDAPLAGRNLMAILQTFLVTFTKEQYLLPIGTAMGFAYVLRHTGCDRHLVQLLVRPLRAVRPALIPGAILVAFAVNIPVISQTSTAVCVGSVLVPLLRAAGFSPLTVGATLLLGASVGGELLNPGAPELNTVSARILVPTPQVVAAVAPLLAVQLAVALLTFWPLALWAERQTPADTTPPVAEELPPRVNVLKAAIPVLPLALLFLTTRVDVGGQQYQAFAVPKAWLVTVPSAPSLPGASRQEPGDGEQLLRERLLATHRAAVKEADLSYNNRLIGAAMIAGVLAALATSPRKAADAAKAFFEGAGYAMAHVVSLIVVAVCLGRGIELAGLDAVLGALIAAVPWLFWPLAGFLPLGFGAVSGSGMAATQSLYGFFVEPADARGFDRISAGAVVSLGAAAGRTLSPAAAVTLMCASLTGTSPLALSARVAGPLVLAVAAVVAVRMAWPG